MFALGFISVEPRFILLLVGIDDSLAFIWWQLIDVEHLPIVGILSKKHRVSIVTTSVFNLVHQAGKVSTG